MTHTTPRRRSARPIQDDDLLARIAAPPAAGIADRAECLEQLLEAFRDIADRDDIHQAADRLAQVQDWIRREAARAADDPIFTRLRLAS